MRAGALSRGRLCTTSTVDAGGIAWASRRVPWIGLDGADKSTRPLFSIRRTGSMADQKSWGVLLLAAAAIVRHHPPTTTHDSGGRLNEPSLTKRTAPPPPSKKEFTSSRPHLCGAVCEVACMGSPISRSRIHGVCRGNQQGLLLPPLPHCAQQSINNSPTLSVSLSLSLSLSHTHTHTHQMGLSLTHSPTRMYATHTLGTGMLLVGLVDIGAEFDGLLA